MRTLILAAASLLIVTVAPAQDVNMDRVNDIADRIKAWALDPVVLDAIKRQNTAHASLTRADIDAKDKQWRAETKASSSPMIDAVLSNSLSSYLSGVKDGGQGLYTEIIVMDNKGLNVGQSDATTDYWQGDEAKFQKTFGVGPEGMHVAEVEFDDSAQAYQLQLSMTISDGGAPIGAVTVGIDAEALQ